MILKKPYAFLIKYFRVINFALAILAGYSAYRFYHIIAFFNEYVTSNYTGNYYPGFYENYIYLYVYLAIILIIIGIGDILLLFIYKKKKDKSYLIALIYYIIYFIGIILIKNVMITMENGVIATETARIYRDLTIIAMIPQIPFVILFLIRGFGFNLEHFNFSQDIKELKAQDDDEEIEITFKQDGVKLKRNIRRFIREFTYYIKENRFFFVIICSVIVLVGGNALIKALPKNVNGKFSQGDYFESLGVKYQIQDSIITNLDYKGDVINKDKYYIVVKLYFENNSNESIAIDYNRFRLENKKEYLYPNKEKGLYFIDYAKDYYGSRIGRNTKNTYSLVYEISEKDIRKSYKLKIDSGLASNKNEIIGKYDFITIRPVVVDTVKTEGTYKLDSDISFASSNLKNTTLKFSNLEITNKYAYNYEYCTTYNTCDTYINQVQVDNTKNNTTLIVLDYVGTIDKNIPFSSANTSIDSIISSFMKVRYIENKKYTYAKVTNVTPNNLKDKIILETTNKIVDSDEISLSITIRNKEYIVRLK